MQITKQESGAILFRASTSERRVASKRRTLETRVQVLERLVRLLLEDPSPEVRAKALRELDVK